MESKKGNMASKRHFFLINTNDVYVTNKLLQQQQTQTLPVYILIPN